MVEQVDRREVVARIVDPEAFRTLREIAAEAGLDADNPPTGVVLLDPVDGPRNAMLPRCHEALAKADAILAALQPAQGEGELLPCPNPWCSSHEHGPEGAPKLPDDLWELSGSNRVRIGCAYCPVRGPTALTEAEAIAAWNRRAPLPALREKDARIAALEGALRLCRETLKEARDHLTPRDAFGDVGDNCLRAEEAARTALEASHE